MNMHAAARGARSGLSVVETMVLVAIAFALIGAALMSGTDRTSPVQTRTVKIAPGETLWEVASTNPVPGLTTAQTVECIAELNRLTRLELAAGQSLKVPRTEYESAVAAR